MKERPVYKQTVKVGAVEVPVTIPYRVLNMDDPDVRFAYSDWGVRSIGSLEEMRAAHARADAKVQFAPPDTTSAQVAKAVMALAPILPAFADQGALRWKWTTDGPGPITTTRRGPGWEAGFVEKSGAVVASLNYSTPSGVLSVEERLRGPLKPAAFDAWCKRAVQKCKRAADRLARSLGPGMTLTPTDADDY